MRVPQFQSAGKTFLVAVGIASVLLVGCRDRIRDTADIPGNKKAFDPVAAIPEVAKFTGLVDSSLARLRARMIKPDGTLDITADYGPRVFYTFIARAPVNATPATREQSPPRADEAAPSGSEGEVWFLANVEIRKPFSRRVESKTSDKNGRGSVEKFHGGMEKAVTQHSDDHLGPAKYYVAKIDAIRAAKGPLPFSEIWKRAIEAGAPAKDAVAVIEYDAAAGYRFEIINTPHNFRFDLEGKLVDEHPDDDTIPGQGPNLPPKR